MAELAPSFAACVLAACRQRAELVADSLAEALGGRPEVEAGQLRDMDGAGAPAGLSGPGLALTATVQGADVFMALPEAGGLLAVQPGDDSGETARRLADLAQRLAVALWPESLPPLDCRGAHVGDLAQAMPRGAALHALQCAEIQIRQGERSGVLFVVGPLERPGGPLPSAGPAPARVAAGPAPIAARPRSDRSSTHPKDGFQLLPKYSRSLLRVELPVVVTLAASKQPLRRILELGPGSIIKFDKSYEEPLSLGIGDHEVAVGEAVKVGDKFGLRITSMVLPGERFQSVKAPGGRKAPPARSTST